MFSNNAVVSVFEKRPLTSRDGREYGQLCRVSSSRIVKDSEGNPVVDENGRRQYQVEFSGWVRFVSKAYEYINSIEIGERPVRVRLNRVGVSSHSKKNDDGTWNNSYTFTVFEASDPNTNNEDNVRSESKEENVRSESKEENVQESEDSADLPF